MSALASRLANLNPFKEEDSDDEGIGEEIDSDTIAGGGHGARRTDVTRNQLRVSHALRSYLVHAGVTSEEEVGLDDPNAHTETLQALLVKPHISVPPSVTDRSHTLPEYFISSSHNTYLHANQLFGKSSATSYETVLRAGSRCIEIDAWDDDDHKDEPKVTHGYTLVSHISLRAVCEAIRVVVDEEAAQEVNAQGYRAAPILVSLENHCDAHGQMRIVQIMKEVLGNRLISEDIREKGHREQQGTDDHVRLSELGSKVAVIVEYHLPKDDADEASSNSDESEYEKEEGNASHKTYKEKKKSTSGGAIIPELAALGVYAQSVKPHNKSWYDPGVLKNGPHHHLINVSESGLGSKMPANSSLIARHNAHHLMRVFPKGTRISSRNLRPATFWAVGAQICALNWQTFESGMQLNEAMFSGTDGYVLKPAALRPGGEHLTGLRRRRLRLHVAGATDVPLTGDVDEARPYLTCTLGRAGGGRTKRKTQAYKHHKLGFLHRGENPPASDPVWDEVLEWEFDDDELVFLRMLIKNDVSFARNPVFTIAAVRLLYVVPGWRFIRMLDLKGRETKCSVLVKFEIEDLE
jgi:phosphatidylinositol phospholipase C delta